MRIGIGSWGFCSIMTSCCTNWGWKVGPLGAGAAAVFSGGGGGGAAANGLFHVLANLLAKHVVDFEHFDIGNALLTLGTHKVVLKEVRLDALFTKGRLTA